ncbi:protein of unknown function [Burkholderia multivorans]
MEFPDLSLIAYRAAALRFNVKSICADDASRVFGGIVEIMPGPRSATHPSSTPRKHGRHAVPAQHGNSNIANDAKDNPVRITPLVLLRKIIFTGPAMRDRQRGKQHNRVTAGRVNRGQSGRCPPFTAALPLPISIQFPL